jgi:hypothetical protein
MPSNPWLAVDVDTALAERAGELRRAWEQFLAGKRVNGVRAPVATSWQRSIDAGVEPRRPAPIGADGDEVSACWAVHPLAEAAPVVRHCLGGIGEDAQHLIAVSDAEGLLLWIDGGPKVRASAAHSMNFTEGGLWSETGAGTNAIGTTLATGHPVQIFAGEHFKEVAHSWTCSAAPVRDPDTGELLGAVGLTAPLTAVHPHTLAVATATAEAVETHLRWRLQERHNRLHSHYQERIAGGPDRRALVTSTGHVVIDHPAGWLRDTRVVPPPGGGEVELLYGTRVFAEPLGHEEAFVVRALPEPDSALARPLLRLGLLGRDRAMVEIDRRPVQLGRRHSEILALLCTQSAGITGQRLATELYGDAGQPGAARVVVHRLRKVLGPWIQTDPYRLYADVECDVARVKGLLDRGAVREAVECYNGPLLPRSEAPGVVRERDALDGWLRHAAITTGDDDALWAWVQSTSGGEDLTAWKRLLAHLDFRDPRRSLAAARVGSLRATYAMS